MRSALALSHFTPQRTREKRETIFTTQSWRLPPVGVRDRIIFTDSFEIPKIQQLSLSGYRFFPLRFWLCFRPFGERSVFSHDLFIYPLVEIFRRILFGRTVILLPTSFTHR